MSKQSLGADLVGESPQFRAVLEKVQKILGHSSGPRRSPPILIQGETGTGKGALARAIWRVGARAAQRFVEVNCAAIPEALLEAELFGFERGAFTGAQESKPGLFQEAHRGTLFLDEVGLLPEAQQAKLLAVVEEGAVRRLGRTRSETVDDWILAASSEDLYGAVREHRFREDLYHRLAVVTLSLPPLRERGSDILLLAERFLARDTIAYSLPPRTFAPDARAVLLSYSWPGNIRELANVVERVALLAEGPVVTAKMLALPEESALSWEAKPGGSRRAPQSGGPVAAGPLPPDGDGASELSPDRLADALARTNGNISRAAKMLGLTRNQLRYRIERRQVPAETPVRRSGNGWTPSLRERRGGIERQPGSGSLPVSTFRWEQRHLALLLVSARGKAADLPVDAAQLFETVERKVQSFGGRIVEIARSDGSILAAFGLDKLEEAPTRAALAAMALRKAWEQDGPGASPPAQGRGRDVGLALHVAPFDVGRSPRFARIDRGASAAASDLLGGLLKGEPPGAIVVSAESRDLLARKFALGPGSRTTAWHLLHRKEVSDPQTASAARFVGREKPLGLLRDLLEKADSGQGQIVGITGEPGIGKSRLFLEFRRAIRERRINYIGAHCESHTAGIPFFPVIKLIQASCGLTEADSPETTAAKVVQNLDSLGIDGTAARPYLLKLLGVRQSAEMDEQLAALSSEKIHSRTFEVIWQMIWNKNGRPQPLVIGVEDSHWIDNASEGYFQRLAERLSAARVLFLMTYRSGYRHPVRSNIPNVPWTEIALEPLTPEESREVMDGMVRRDDIPEPLAETILARADGNPFFLEELALSVGCPTARSEPPAVPETIHAAIESRFDRLEDAPRRLLETAAILGREVSLRILRKMWSGTGSIESLLEELVRLEFLTPKRREEGIWVFKHPLIQEVAYERLQPSDRTALHGIAGRSVETLYAGRLEEAYDRLAYHYSKSGEREQAVEYLTRFADKAVRSNALAEAVTALEEAFKLAERLGAGSQRDAQLVELVLRRARCLTFLGRLAETRDLLAGERERFEASPDPSIRARYHFALAATQRFLGDREPASDNAQRALAEAASLGEDASIGKVHFELAMQSIWSGDSARGLEEACKAAARFSRAGNPRWQGMTHWMAGVHEYLLGSFERALDSEAKAATIGRAIDDLRIQSYAAGVVGLVWAARGDWEQSLEHCEFSLSCSPDPINTACSLAFSSQAHRAKGDLAKSIEQLVQAIDLMTEHQLLPMKGWATAWLAEVVLESGQRNEARELADESLKICRRVGPPFACGLAERVLGQLAHTERRHSKAREFLERSLHTFQGMGSEFEAGRTGMELARLARVENQPLAATKHLARAASRFEAAGARVSAARAAALAEEL